MDRSGDTLADASSQEADQNSGAGAGKPIGLGLLDQRLGYWTRRAQIGIFQDFFQAFRQHGIRPAQYSALTVIERNPGLTQTQVADVLGIKKANFVALIRELETRQFVRRKTARRDKRSYGLFLSEAGAILMPELHKASEAHEGRVRDVLGDDRYREALASLRALAAALHGADVDNTDDSYMI